MTGRKDLGLDLHLESKLRELQFTRRRINGVVY